MELQQVYVVSSVKLCHTVIFFLSPQALRWVEREFNFWKNLPLKTVLCPLFELCVAP